VPIPSTASWATRALVKSGRRCGNGYSRANIRGTKRQGRTERAGERLSSDRPTCGAWPLAPRKSCLATHRVQRRLRSVCDPIAGASRLGPLHTRDGRQTVTPADSPDEVGPMVDEFFVPLPTGARQHRDRKSRTITAARPGVVDRAAPQQATPARIVLHAAREGRVAPPEDSP